MKKLKILSYLFLLTTCLLPKLSQAGGIAVTPGKLNLEINSTPGQIQPVIVKVNNPGAETAAFEVYLEDFPNTLKITPRIFVLSSGGQTEIELSPNLLELTKAGNPRKLTLNFVSTDLKNNQVLVSAGYKMNISLNYNGARSQQFNLTTDKFLIGLLTLVLVVVSGLVSKKK